MTLQYNIYVNAEYDYCAYCSSVSECTHDIPMFRDVRSQSLMDICIFLLLIQLYVDGCPKLLDSVCGNVGTVTWPETEIGQEASVPCQCGLEDPLIQLLSGTRRCGGTYDTGAEWEEAQCDDCIFSDTRRDLCALAEVG